MTREWQLDRGGKDPHLVRVLTCLHGEGRFAEIGLSGDPLHQLRRARIEDDAQRISLQRTLREDVDQAVAQSGRHRTGTESWRRAISARTSGFVMLSAGSRASSRNISSSPPGLQRHNKAPPPGPARMTCGILRGTITKEP